MTACRCLRLLLACCAALPANNSAQVAVVQSDARAELEAAQTRMQLLRLKQQRMAKCLAAGPQSAAADTLAAWRDKS
jgi:hypothetical protein